MALGSAVAEDRLFMFRLLQASEIDVAPTDGPESVDVQAVTAADWVLDDSAAQARKALVCGRTQRSAAGRAVDSALALAFLDVTQGARTICSALAAVSVQLVSLHPVRPALITPSRPALKTSPRQAVPLRANGLSAWLGRLVRTTGQYVPVGVFRLRWPALAHQEARRHGAGGAFPRGCLGSCQKSHRAVWRRPQCYLTEDR